MKLIEIKDPFEVQVDEKIIVIDAHSLRASVETVQKIGRNSKGEKFASLTMGCLKEDKLNDRYFKFNKDFWEEIKSLRQKQTDVVKNAIKGII